jgi:peptidyl-prolyl cis-trans isomerase C
MRARLYSGKELRIGALVLATALGACREHHQSSVAPSTSASAGAGKLSAELAAQVLAKVGDREITLGEYAETLARMDPFERLRYQSTDRRKQLLNEIIQVELLAAEAKRRGLDKLPETQERMRQMLKEEVLRDVRRKIAAPSDIPEADVRAYFDAHHDEFKEPERRRVAHLVLSTEAEAKAALRRALSGSASDWGKLVAEVSLDKPAKSAGPSALELAGDLGIVGPPGHPRGGNPRVPEALRAAVFQIDRVGGVLDHVLAEGGRFHVLRMTGRTEARDRSFADAERTIRVTLVQERIRQRELQLEQELKQRYPVTIDDQALAAAEVPAPESAAPAAPTASAR